MDVSQVEADDGRWVVKRAESAEESARLCHEAMLLRQAAHPGVVELGRLEIKEDGMASLSTRHTGGRDLSTIAGLDVAELSGLGAAVATIIADLHDVGISHGAVRAEHVVVGADGRPALCSLGRAGATSEVDAADDLAALRLLLREQLPSGAPAKLVRLLREPSGHSKRGSARSLAASLARIVPDARLPVESAPMPSGPTPSGPTPSRPTQDQPGLPLSDDERPEAAGAAAQHGRHEDLRVTAERARRSVTAAQDQKHLDASVLASGWHRRDVAARTVRRAALMVVLVAVVGVVARSAITRLTLRHDGSEASAASTPCPAADDGCGPVPAVNGQFSTPSGRFAIDMPAAVVVIGRWQCRSPSLPAALDPHDGRVWVWDRWPGTKTVEARSLGVVQRAATLDVLPEASGCDWLEVVRAAGRPIVLRPEEATS